MKAEQELRKIEWEQKLELERLEREKRYEEARVRAEMDRADRDK